MEFIFTCFLLYCWNISQVSESKTRRSTSKIVTNGVQGYRNLPFRFSRIIPPCHLYHLLLDSYRCDQTRRLILYQLKKVSQTLAYEQWCMQWAISQIKTTFCDILYVSLVTKAPKLSPMIREGSKPSESKNNVMISAGKWGHNPCPAPKIDIGS